MKARWVIIPKFKNFLIWPLFPEYQFCLNLQAFQTWVTYQKNLINIVNKFSFQNYKNIIKFKGKLIWQLKIEPVYKTMILRLSLN